MNGWLELIRGEEGCGEEGDGMEMQWIEAGDEKMKQIRKRRENFFLQILNNRVLNN